MPSSTSGLGSPDFSPLCHIPWPSSPLPTSVDDLLGKGLSIVGQAVVTRTLDGLSRLARSAGDRVADLANTVREQLSSLPNSAANAVADSMRGSAARTLTAGETSALRSAFGNSIDLSNVRIVNGPGRNPDAWTAFNFGGNPALTEGNTVFMQSDRYRCDFSATPADINMLVHEFAHVRQFQHMGFGSFFGKYASDLATYRDRNMLYDYGSRTNHFRTETIEGQAEMIGDYAGYRAGQTGEGALSAAQVANIESRLRGTGLFGL